MFGGVAGLLIAAWSETLLRTVLPTELQRINVIEIDSVVIAFTVALCIVAALSFGLVTALRATKLDLVSLLKDGSASVTGHGHARLGAGLFVAQVALSFTLLAGAGLMVRTLVRLLAVDPGFTTEEILTLDVLLPESKFHLTRSSVPPRIMIRPLFAFECPPSHKRTPASFTLLNHADKRFDSHT